MLREIIHPDTNQYMLHLPDELVGQDVEVLAYRVPKHQNQTTNDEAAVAKRAEALRAFLKANGGLVDLSHYTFSRDEANNYD